MNAQAPGKTHGGGGRVAGWRRARGRVAESTEGGARRIKSISDGTVEMRCGAMRCDGCDAGDGVAEGGGARLGWLKGWMRCTQCRKKGSEERRVEESAATGERGGMGWAAALFGTGGGSVVVVGRVRAGRATGGRRERAKRLSGKWTQAWQGPNSTERAPQTNRAKSPQDRVGARDDGNGGRAGKRGW